MPSPTCRIPITLNPSTWFRPITGAEAQAFIPPSIGAGEVVTLENSIKVLIRSKDVPPLPDTHFFEQDVLSVSARMPWLNRTLPNFEYSCFIDIQYPVVLRGVDILASLAQGSTSRFTFQVSFTVSSWLIILIGFHLGIQPERDGVGIGYSLCEERRSHGIF